MRSIDKRISASIIGVLAALLALQYAMNTLKYRALLIDSAASQMQIAAAGVERSIAKAEQLGLGLREIRGLDSLLRRERGHAELVRELLVVDAEGRTVAATSGPGLPDIHRAAVLRRVLTSAEPMSDIAIGGDLYVGRLLRDSGDAPMGAVILTATGDSFLPRLAAMRRDLAAAFGLLFAALALVAWPVLHTAFAGTRRALGLLDAVAAGDGTADGATAGPLGRAIADGRHRRDAAWDDLAAIEAPGAIGRVA